jgi:hypothetical protein
MLHECSPAANAGGLPALTIGASGMMRSALHQYPEMRNAPQWRNCEALNLVFCAIPTTRLARRRSGFNGRKVRKPPQKLRRRRVRHENGWLHSYCMANRSFQETFELSPKGKFNNVEQYQCRVA